MKNCRPTESICVELCNAYSGDKEKFIGLHLKIKYGGTRGIKTQQKPSSPIIGKQIVYNIENNSEPRKIFFFKQECYLF